MMILFIVIRWSFNTLLTLNFGTWLFIEGGITEFWSTSCLTVTDRVESDILSPCILKRSLIVTGPSLNANNSYNYEMSHQLVVNE